MRRQIRSMGSGPWSERSTCETLACLRCDICRHPRVYRRDDHASYSGTQPGLSDTRFQGTLRCMLKKDVHVIGGCHFSRKRSVGRPSFGKSVCCLTRLRRAPGLTLYDSSVHQRGLRTICAPFSRHFIENRRAFLKNPSQNLVEILESGSRGFLDNCRAKISVYDSFHQLSRIFEL